jgi:hypothetical protein
MDGREMVDDGRRGFGHHPFHGITIADIGAMERECLLVHRGQPMLAGIKIVDDMQLGVSRRDQLMNKLPADVARSAGDQDPIHEMRLSFEFRRAGQGLGDKWLGIIRGHVEWTGHLLEGGIPYLFE